MSSRPLDLWCNWTPALFSFSLDDLCIEGQWGMEVTNHPLSLCEIQFVSCSSSCVCVFFFFFMNLGALVFVLQIFRIAISTWWIFLGWVPSILTLWSTFGLRSLYQILKWLNQLAFYIYFSLWDVYPLLFIGYLIYILNVIYPLCWSEFLGRRKKMEPAFLSNLLVYVFLIG